MITDVNARRYLYLSPVAVLVGFGLAHAALAADRRLPGSRSET